MAAGNYGALASMVHEVGRSQDSGENDGAGLLGVNGRSQSHAGRLDFL